MFTKKNNVKVIDVNEMIQARNGLNGLIWHIHVSAEHINKVVMDNFFSGNFTFTGKLHTAYKEFCEAYDRAIDYVIDCWDELNMTEDYQEALNKDLEKATEDYHFYKNTVLGIS